MRASGKCPCVNDPNLQSWDSIRPVLGVDAVVSETEHSSIGGIRNVMWSRENMYE